MARKFFSAVISPFYIYNNGTDGCHVTVQSITNGDFNPLEDGEIYITKNKLGWINTSEMIDFTEYSKLYAKIKHPASGTAYCKLKINSDSGVSDATTIFNKTISCGTPAGNWYTACFDISGLTGKGYLRFANYNKNGDTYIYSESYISQIYLTE